MIASNLRNAASRFPLALLGLVCVTAIVFCSANNFVFGDSKAALQAVLPLTVGTVLAVAGSLFKEGHETSRLSFPLTWLLPPAAVTSLVILPSTVAHPLMSLGAAVLWMSIAATVGNKGQVGIFVQLNRAAVWEGLLALLLVGIGAAGIVAIEAAVSTLFKVLRDNELISFSFPILLCFIGPLFWLCRLPRLDDIRADGGTSDRLSRSMGLVGSWAVTPVLFIYAAILIAYMGLMLLAWELPSNRIGWMVLSFLLAGATNWLLLAGEEDRGQVRIFRRTWFWLALPPLVLLAFATFLRIDAYGVTPNRAVLVAGTAWGMALSLFYLAGRGDLRLIPALGAAALALIAVGPFNIDAVSARNQAHRLLQILDDADVHGLSSGRRLTLEENSAALAAMTHLFYEPDRRPMLDDVLGQHGITLTPDQVPYDLIDAWGYDGSRDALGAQPGEIVTTFLQAWLEEHPPLDLGTTPIFLGEFDLLRDELRPAGPIGIGFAGQDLLIGGSVTGPTDSRQIPLEVWLANESGSTLSGQAIDFTETGIRYRAVPTVVRANRYEKDGAGRYEIERLSVLLFMSKESQ